jgi:hypothetical protein
MKTMVFAFFASLALASCASNTSNPTSDAGPPPNVRAIVLAHKAQLFKDPDSVRDASITEPWRYLALGWRVCLRANGRNSYGGYSGQQTYTILVYDDRTRPPHVAEPVIYDDCNGRSYSAFSELESVAPSAAKR